MIKESLTTITGCQDLSKTVTWPIYNAILLGFLENGTDGMHYLGLCRMKYWCPSFPALLRQNIMYLCKVLENKRRLITSVQLISIHVHIYVYLSHSKGSRHFETSAPNDSKMTLNIRSKLLHTYYWCLSPKFHCGLLYKQHFFSYRLTPKWP